MRNRCNPKWLDWLGDEPAAAGGDEGAADRRGGPIDAHDLVAVEAGDEQVAARPERQPHVAAAPRSDIV
jgi:hypothetical protein